MYKSHATLGAWRPRTLVQPATAHKHKSWRQRWHTCPSARTLLAQPPARPSRRCHLRTSGQEAVCGHHQMMMGCPLSRSIPSASSTWVTGRGVHVCATHACCHCDDAPGRPSPHCCSRTSTYPRSQNSGGTTVRRPTALRCGGGARICTACTTARSLRGCVRAPPHTHTHCRATDKDTFVYDKPQLRTCC